MKNRRWLVCVGITVITVAMVAIKVYPVVRQVVSDRNNTETFEQAVSKNAQVPAGLLVENVTVLSKANLFGLHPGDIITNYNGTRVTNFMTYRAAVDRNVADNVSYVSLTLFRAGKAQQLSAPSGLLGFDGRDWTPLSDAVARMVYDNRTAPARALVDGADKSIVSEEDLLIARLLVLDEHSPGVEEERQKLMQQLMPHLFDFEDIARKFSDIDEYRNAIPLLIRTGEEYPRCLSCREDLALSYARTGQLDNADHVIQDILKNHKEDMTDHNWYFVLKARAETSAARKNYDAAIRDYERAFEVERANPIDTDMRIRYLFALAKLGNPTEFQKGIAFCDQHRTPDWSKQRYSVDALRAYVLVRNGDDVKARAAVQEWRNHADIKRWNVAFFSSLAGGEDVVESWNRLLN